MPLCSVATPMLAHSCAVTPGAKTLKVTDHWAAPPVTLRSGACRRWSAQWYVASPLLPTQIASDVPMHVGWLWNAARQRYGLALAKVVVVVRGDSAHYRYVPVCRLEGGAGR